MTAAMCLIRVLALLSTVTVCSGGSTPSGATTEAPTSTAHLPTPAAFTTAQTATSTPQPQTTIPKTQKTTRAVTSTSASTQTSDRTERIDPSTLSANTTTVQTSEEVTQRSTLPAASNSTDVPVAATQTNTTNSAPSPDWEKSNLLANPGLVAVICMFCFIVALMVVVAAVKCIQSPRSNFERLEDVPLGKVSEESPFANYSK